ncbi:hypothetical protein FPV67DRAFT_1679299 [Lyophyllum atratum]|nr:hypothetical protein FPV67DRAFT_1679299 [Lyophyllum atratum]
MPQADEDGFAPPGNGKPNVGIFGKKGLGATIPQDSFLRFLAPIFHRATKEKKVDIFFELLYPVWFDRYPVILLDGFDDIDGEEFVDPDRVEWATKLQSNLLRSKIYWNAWWQLGHSLTDPKYDAWEQLLTVKADRERRRVEYFKYAKMGIYFQGHEFDVVITAEEREMVEMTPEEQFDTQLNLIEMRHFAHMKFLEMPDM